MFSLDTFTIRLVVFFALLILLTACAETHRHDLKTPACDNTALQQKTQETWQKIDALALDLSMLHGPINHSEARQIAKTAVTYSKYLAVEYRLVGSPYLHNVLVRMGLKERGLCYHWTEDLIKRLKRLKLKTYQLHWGVAYPGSEFREHNCVVITAWGQAFDEGIVLDPWRNSGNLYWVRASDDKYPWQKEN